jgi:2,4-dienoyl-CoA reductase-like NADH-dependent reductase (Old Yellow Enzyme family)
MCFQFWTAAENLFTSEQSKEMKLYEALTIHGKLELANRTTMPPLVTRLAAEEGEITDELSDGYLLYAQESAGIIGLQDTKSLARGPRHERLKWPGENPSPF